MPPARPASAFRGVRTNPGDAGRETDRWKLQIVDSTIVFYIYSSHLQASPGGANEQLRLDGVTVIRNDADTLPDGTHIV